eukprot:NODE_7817_length_741_cov_99.666667_g7566_i0.p1 GENE.NODE_7817_length_741_cov_99.666667_g7566_i0~~NODE_7817_length_741_cov_99.666667_g7566_i0.p1  ORF type:complete len:173 (+),score=39.00 NODE_7817_length_741_cov_99.666667_g7566_i0:81-599(+)
MGGSGSKGKAAPELPAGVNVTAPTMDIPPEIREMISVDTEKLMKPEFRNLPANEAIELSFGLLLERVFCQQEGGAFYQCFAQSGEKDPVKVSNGVCQKENQAFEKCARTGSITDSASTLVELFAYNKCPTETSAFRKCKQDGKPECDKEAVEAFGCGSRHVLALLQAGGPPN